MLSIKKPGEYLYLSMSDDPLEPGGSTLRRGRPPYGRVERAVSFEDLPRDCRWLVMNIYWDLWGLREDGGEMRRWLLASLPDAE